MVLGTLDLGIVVIGTFVGDRVAVGVARSAANARVRPSLASVYDELSAIALS